jgi:hypothetical protein
MKLYQNAVWMRKRYIFDKKKPEDIAKECNASTETIYLWLEKHGLRKKRT